MARDPTSRCGRPCDMFSSSTITAWITRVESWIQKRPRPLVLCPLRLLVVVLLFLILMASNLLAVLCWPLSALLRRVRVARRQTGDPLHVDDQKLTELIESQQPVLIDFWAAWCAPCLLLNRTLQDYLNSDDSPIIVAKVNATLHPVLTRQHQVNALPTLVLFDGGQELRRHIGLIALEELRQFVKGADQNEARSCGERGTSVP